MRPLRIALLVFVSVLVVTLVACEAVHEAPLGELREKDVRIGALVASVETYVPTMPLQARYSSATTWSDPTWNRPEEDGSPLAVVTTVHYQVQAFEVSGAGLFHIHSLQEYDGYLHLYGGSFDPASPFTGFLTADDDYEMSVGESLMEAELVPGTTYYVVTSAFADLGYGSFTNSIYGPSTVTLGEGTGPDLVEQAAYSASTEGAPTFNRLEDYAALSDAGTAVPYHVQPFFVAESGRYAVRSAQEYDGYLHLYGGSFDPDDPLAGFLVGNDDFGARVSLVEYDLAPGTTYYIVTSGYTNDSYGPFTNTIYGPHAVTLVGAVDQTPPVITLYLNSVAAVDESVWHTSSVSATWGINDPETVITVLEGCLPQYVNNDTSGTTLTCRASSFGGTSAATFDLKIDQTPPVVTVTGVTNGATYDLGNIPMAGCETTDGGSGVATEATVLLTGGPTGEVQAICGGALDHAGNIGSAMSVYFVVGPTVDPVEATNRLIGDVEQLVEEGVLKAKQASGLLQPLENALRSLEKDKTLDACNQLGDFIVEVEAKVPPLTAVQAADLIASAKAIRLTLGCE